VTQKFEVQQPAAAEGAFLALVPLLSEHMRTRGYAPAPSMRPAILEILINEPGLEAANTALALVEPGREILRQSRCAPRRRRRVPANSHLLGKQGHQRQERTLCCCWQLSLECLSHDHLQSHHEAWPEKICRVFFPSCRSPSDCHDTGVSAYSWTRNSAAACAATRAWQCRYRPAPT